MMHDLYDQYFEPATALMAEGARVGLATCRKCGACVLLDPRDNINRARQHYEWHEEEGK
jgi:hypothetical protein